MRVFYCHRQYPSNAVSALKDTVPGDFSAMNLSEICELIQEHKSNGPVMEMKR